MRLFYATRDHLHTANVPPISCPEWSGHLPRDGRSRSMLPHHWMRLRQSTSPWSANHLSAVSSYFNWVQMEAGWSLWSGLLSGFSTGNEVLLRKTYYTYYIQHKSSIWIDLSFSPKSPRLPSNLDSFFKRHLILGCNVCLISIKENFSKLNTCKELFSISLLFQQLCLNFKSVGCLLTQSRYWYEMFNYSCKF